MPGPPRPRAPRRLLTRPARPPARSAAEVRLAAGRPAVGAAAAGPGRGPPWGRGGRAGVRAGSERGERWAVPGRPAPGRPPLRAPSRVGGASLSGVGTLPGPAASAGLGSSGLRRAPQCPAARFPRAAGLRPCPAVSRSAAAGGAPGLPARPAALWRPRRSGRSRPFLVPPSPPPRRGWHRGSGSERGSALLQTSEGREGHRAAGGGRRRWDRSEARGGKGGGSLDAGQL